MPNNKRTIYLGLDYSDFTGGVAEVNQKMSVLDATFKQQTEVAKNYGDETDRLGVKHDYLSQKIDLQNQKVNAAKEALEKAQQTEGTSQKTIDQLTVKLAKETTSLEKLKGELKKTDDEQEKLNKNSRSFGDTIRGLASDLGLNVSPAVEKLAKKFDGVSESVGTAIVGIGAIITGFVNCSIEAAHMADDLLTLSSTTNMTTDELQKLEYASKFVDVSVETMSGAITKLTSNMYKSRDGSKTVEDAFKKLHIRVTENNGTLKNANDVFLQAIDRLGAIKNETERDALAMQIFGKSAKELNPLIEAGSGRLKELSEEAERLGVVMSRDDLDALGALNDAMDRFDSTTQALKNSLGLTLLPMLTGLFEVISNIPVPVLKTLVVLASVIASITLVVKAIKSITDTTSSIKKFFDMAQGGMSKTTLIIMGVVAALIALATVIAVIMGKSDDIQKAMASTNTAVTGMQNTVAGAQNATYRAQGNATGVLNFAGGRTWVGEAGPELVTLPRGSSITPASQVGQTEYNTFNITIDAKNVREFNDIVNIVQSQRMALRRI